jgi:Poly(hydroxyalcanoate) granule associated protein (phasin)
MSKKLKKTTDRVWLAGLGALALGEQEGNDLFQQLVRKGREVEKTLGEIEAGRVRIHQYPSMSLLQGQGQGYVSIVKGLEEAPFLRFILNSKEGAKIETRQARRLAAARRAFLKEFGSLDQAAVDWERLHKERRIFTVTQRGATYVPSFQFDEKGNPRPAVERVIQILGKDTSDWGLALWFTAASGYLGGKRPVDVLSSHPEEVIQAAEQEAAELVF